MGKQSATLANEWKRDYDLENRWILVLFAKLIRVNYSQSRNESFKTCPSSPSLPFVKCTTTKRECSMPLLNSSHSFLRSLSPVWPCININKQQWILEEGFYGYEESFWATYIHRWRVYFTSTDPPFKASRGTGSKVQNSDPSLPRKHDVTHTMSRFNADVLGGVAGSYRV